MNVAFEINTQAIDKLASEFPVLFREVSGEVMEEAVRRLVNAVARHTPVGTGTLERSLEGVVEITGAGVSGMVGTPLEYGEVVEYGRSPGSFPPIDPIAKWAVYKLGVPAEQSRRVGFLIARKIYRKGFPGAFMFQKGLNDVLPELEALFQTIPNRIADRSSAMSQGGKSS